jgi:septum site-determining protein MinD
VHRIFSIHSFRGGTGKSNVTANLAVSLARMGKRVAIVDTDIQSPGIHTMFGLGEDRVGRALNDYLWGECPIEDAAYDVTPAELAGHGSVLLVPSSIKPGQIARVLREGYDVARLNDGFRALGERLTLDVLLVDTHPGLNEETLLSIAVSDALLLLLRPDAQDFQGTAVTVEVARRLGVPKLLLVVNKYAPWLDPEVLCAQVESIYGAPVAGLFAHADEMLELQSAGIFSLHYPEHPFSRGIEVLARRLLTA